MSSVIDEIFSGVGNLVKSAGALAPTAAAWKELIDPVKAAQQPTLGMSSATPIIAPPLNPISKTPGVTTMSPTIWIAIGGVVLTLIVVLLSRKT